MTEGDKPAARMTKRTALPEGWKRVLLGDIAQIASGGTPERTQRHYWGGSIPWVTTGEIQFNTITDTAEKITAQGLKQSAAKLFPPGTLLMAMYGQGRTRGQVAKLAIEAATNQACAAIRLSPGCDMEYVYQFLVSRYRAIRELGHSGAQQNLSTGLIKEIAISLPPEREQMRIAEAARVWDAAIATTDKLLANSRRQRRDLMQLLIRKRKAPGQPQDHWQQVDFDEIFERITRKNTVGERQVLTISAQHGLVSQSDYFNRHMASADLRGYTHLTTGDFAYNKSASTGYPMGAIKPLLAHDSGVVSSLYICFRRRSDVQLDADFFRLYFEAGMLNESITGIAQEGARSHGLLNVDVKAFFKLPLHVPPLETQRRIAEVLCVAEQEERCIAAQGEVLRQEKRALMNELFTGRRRLPLSAQSRDIPVAA